MCLCLFSCMRNWNAHSTNVIMWTFQSIGWHWQLLNSIEYFGHWFNCGRAIICLRVHYRAFYHVICTSPPWDHENSTMLLTVVCVMSPSYLPSRRYILICCLCFFQCMDIVILPWLFAWFHIFYSVLVRYDEIKMFNQFIVAFWSISI